MKIGIITYHFAKNYGAVLQCYALQTYLLKQGYDVEIFNFIDENQKNNNDTIKHGKDLRSKVINFCLIPFLLYIKRKNEKFISFCKKELHLSPLFTHLYELENYINKNKFDVIISGSDQVLNCNIDDFNKAFLYPFQTNSKKMFYAASTGNASLDDIAKIEKYILDFSTIAIREKKDLCKFNKKLQSKLEIVCDPVILLNTNEWDNMIEKKKKKPYLLCYFLHKELFSEEFKIAKNFAKKMNLEFKVINARYGRKSFLKGTMYDIGPKEFVDLIANSDYVCTDSFHGTLFSLIFHKRFTCFDTIKNRKDTRRKGFLEEVGALEAFHYIEEKIEICPKLDYEEIDKNIQKMRKNAEQYLEKINEK